MVLAVVDDHADVLHRIARNRARVEHLTHALLDGRDELVRDHAALRLVEELETRAAVERLDAQEHLAELTGAAGLFLVPRVALGARPNRLAERDARRARVDLHLELRRHPFEHGTHVQVAQPANDRLVRGRVVFYLERRILGRNAVQCLRDLLFVAAPLRLDGQAVHRPRERQRTHVDVVLVV